MTTNNKTILKIKINNTLEKFLMKHAVKKEDKDKKVITHTRIGDAKLNIYGGSYSIPDEEYKTFTKLYYNECIKGNKKEYLTEVQLKTNESPIVIDIDFRYDFSVTEKQHTYKHIDFLVELYHDELKKMYQMDEDTEINVFVFEKENVNRVEDKQITKDGIHIIIGLQCNHKIQLVLRERVITRIKQESTILSDLPITNNWEDVFDIGLSKGTTNMQLYGSMKPNNEPYKLKYIYVMKSYNVMSECDVSNYENGENFDQLFIRYKEHPMLFLEDEFIEELNNQEAEPERPTKTNVNVETENENDLFIEDDVLNIRSKEELDVCIQKYIINNEVLEIRDAYAYTMILPDTYYKDQSYDLWIRVGWALRNINYKLFVVWVALSAKSSSFSFTTDIDNLYERWRNFEKKDLTLASIALWAKTDNLNEFQKISQIETGKLYIDIEKVEEESKQKTISYIKPIDIKYFRGGENNVAREISTTLKNTLVYTNERWVICDNKTKLWRYIKDPTATIVTHIQNGIDESRKQLITKKQLCEDEKLKEKYEATEKEYLKYYVEYGKNGVSSQVKKCLQEYLHESSFGETLDNNIYKVAYKNGILDLTTSNFRYGIIPEDKLTKTIPYDYEKATQEDIDFVREELKKICNYKDDHLEYYLSALGYAMTGDSSKLQNFWTIVGQKASNGKSVLFEVLTRIIPNYIIKLENTIFETTYGSRHKEIATWGGARIAWVNEMSKRKQDADFIKNLSDGTPIRYKVMYGEMDNMPVTFKLFTVGNNTISIDADNGVARRMRALQMDSDFVEGLKENDYENKRFILDRKFGDSLATKYKHAFMSLIYEYSHMFAVSGDIKPYPNDWKEETDDVCKDNNKFTTWFNENFEVGDDYKISKAELEEKVKQYTGGKINLKDELKRMRIKFKYDSQQKEKGVKGFYNGFKMSVFDTDINEIP